MLQARDTELFHHEGHEEHEGGKGTAHRSTPISLDPVPGALQSRNQVLDLAAHRIPFFVSFVLFVVNSLRPPVLLRNGHPSHRNLKSLPTRNDEEPSFPYATLPFAFLASLREAQAFFSRPFVALTQAAKVSRHQDCKKLSAYQRSTWTNQPSLALTCHYSLITHHCSATF